MKFTHKLQVSPGTKVKLSRYDAAETLGFDDKDKAEIKDKAEGLEKVRDDASKRSGSLGLAISYFTVAIASASICMVTKKKPLWFVAMAMAVVAIVQMALAWTM